MKKPIKGKTGARGGEKDVDLIVINHLSWSRKMKGILGGTSKMGA